MIMIIIGTIMIIISCIIIYKYYYKLNNLTQEDNEIKRRNELTRIENQKLESEQEALKRLATAMKDKLAEQKQQILNNDKTASQAFEQYCDVLENSYNKIENEYNNYANSMNKAYNKLQDDLMKAYIDKKDELDLKITAVQNDLYKISATRAAAIEAINREKEIKENLEIYCLHISENDLEDIKVLEQVKKQLHQPRILSMLIWQSYYRTPMGQLCVNLLGTSTKCGIYKITNQITNECYIGQSVDIDKRWKDHAKCGLGIDTPAGNKLYKAMKEYGLNNFSFELLEECPRELLNEKETFYIQSYQSDKFGYNSTSGNKT